MPSAAWSAASVKGSQIGVDEASVGFWTKLMVSGRGGSLFCAVVNSAVLTVQVLVRARSIKIVVHLQPWFLLGTWFAARFWHAIGRHWR